MGEPYATMCGIARRMAFRALGDWDEADDIGQHVLIKAAEVQKKNPKAFDLLLTALAGAYLPAYRSSRVDPLVAMRAE